MTVRQQGRIAGLVYLGVVLTGIFSLAYAPSQLFAGDDPAKTAAVLSENLALFRMSNFAAIAMCAFFFALPFTFARFLAAYGRNAARLMILFVAASLPFSLLALSQHFELVALAEKGALTPDAVAAGITDYDRLMGLASIFWGLWLAPLGWLIVKSGVIPRLLGVLLIAGCAGYLASYFGPMLYEGFDDLSFRGWISKPGSIGEIGTCLWLLVMGARETTSN